MSRDFPVLLSLPKYEPVEAFLGFFSRIKTQYQRAEILNRKRRG